MLSSTQKTIPLLPDYEAIELEDDLSLRSIYQLSTNDARNFLSSCRWNGEEGPRCVWCDSPGPYIFNTRPIYRCYLCFRQFSITSQSLLSGTKMSLQDIIAGAYLFVSGAKGVSSIQMAKNLTITQKTAFVMMHKFREAIAHEVLNQKLSGIVEIDGATFGGHRKHANISYDYSGSFRRFAVKNVKQRRVIVVAKQRGGRTVPFVGKKESDGINFIIETLEDGTIIQADGARAWNSLEKLFKLIRIYHSYQFASNLNYTNNAESYFSRMRRCHAGTHHHMSGELMLAYACEMAWKSDHKDLSSYQRTVMLLSLVLNTSKSDRWNGYWAHGGKGTA